MCVIDVWTFFLRLSNILLFIIWLLRSRRRLNEIYMLRQTSMKKELCSFPFCVYFSLNLTELVPAVRIDTYLLAHLLEYLFELLLHKSKYKCFFITWFKRRMTNMIPLTSSRFIFDRNDFIRSWWRYKINTPMAVSAYYATSFVEKF